LQAEVLGVGAEVARFGGTSGDLSQPAGTSGFSPRVSVDVSRLNFLGLGHSISLRSRLSNLEQLGSINYLAPRFRNVWLVGGAQLCRRFLELGLVDEIRLSIAPVLLGNGLSLFGTAGDESRWRLKDVVPYKTGFVELVYRSDRGSR